MRILSIDVGIKNLAIVKMDICSSDNVQIKDVFLLDICDKGKAKDTKFDDKIKNLISLLDNIDLKTIEKVIIENPPSLKNPQLKSIGVALYVYFTTKNINSQFISPSKKLSKEENKILTYKERKAKAIERVLEKIGKINCDFLDKFKKKDDICDCILQAIMSYDKYKI